MITVTMNHTTSTFGSHLNSIQLHVEPFKISRCDERTLYIPISLQYKGDKKLCDLIYLIDKQHLLGAISLNIHYDQIREFFLRHFDYNLLYSDEQHLAKIVSSSPQFKHYLKQFAADYPKHAKKHLSQNH